MRAPRHGTTERQGTCSRGVVISERTRPGGYKANGLMPIRAVVFDIGGVLELTPPTGWVGRWEDWLGLEPGQIEDRLEDVFRAGTLGTISEAEVERRIAATLGLDALQTSAFMGDPGTTTSGR